MAADVRRLHGAGAEHERGVQPHRRDADGALGEAGDVAAVAALADGDRAGGRAGCERVHVAPPGVRQPVFRERNGWYPQDGPSSAHAPLVTRSYTPPSRRLMGAVALVVVYMAALGVPEAMGASSSFSGTVTAGGTAVQNFKITVSSPGQITATMQWSTPSAALRL